MLDINSIKLILETLIANLRCGDYRDNSYMFCTKHRMFIVFKVKYSAKTLTTFFICLPFVFCLHASSFLS